MKKQVVVIMGLLLAVSLAVGAQVAPQFDVIPRIPVVGEPTSFISWFPPGYDVHWSVNNVPVGIGQTIKYVFPSIGTYLIVMEVFQGPHLVYSEEQLVKTQYSPPGYNPIPPPESPYVPPETDIDLDLSSASTVGLIFIIIGALLLLLEQ